MPPLRILVVSPTFAPAVNGLANVALKYCTGLVSHGHQVEVVTTGKVSYDYEGLSVITFDISGNFSLKSPLRGELLNYIRFLRSSSYDLIICHALQTGIVDLTFLFAKNPILYFSHGVSWKSSIMPKMLYAISRKISYLPYRVMGPLIIKRAKYAVFLGDKVINDRTFDSRYFPSSRKAVIPNASDFPSEQPKNYTCVGRLKILVVGACSPEKGFDRLLDLIPKLSGQSVESITICTFDSGSYFHFFKNELSKRNKDIVVEFVLNQSGGQLLPYYSESDILLNLSHSECYPLVVADAENCRLPTICYDTGYQKEIPGACIVKSADEAAALINEFPGNQEKFRLLSELTKPRAWHESCEDLNNFIEKIAEQQKA